MTNFDDILGQSQIKENLMQAVSKKTVSHAYIIYGEKDSGKEFIADIFASALQCEKGDINPCGECHTCKMSESGNNPDIIKVTHEKPGVIGVDDIRDKINNDIQIKPYKCDYKIYIVNEAEKMNIQAQNALLKTLEEPPQYGIIILLTTNIDAFLPTILSRCVVLNMRPVSDRTVKKFLMEDICIPSYKADVCVAFARGNIGKAKHLAINEDFENIKNEVLSLLRYVKDMDAYEMAAAIKKIVDYKLDINDYLDLMAVWFRDVLLYKATNDINHLVFKEEISDIRRAADRSTYEGLEEIVLALDSAKKRLDANVSFEVVMELLFLTIKEKG